MIQSMTGYGKAEINLNTANFTIEVRSLNSKQIDVTVKMSSIYREKEIGIRKLISKKLQRGKIELSIWREKSIPSSNYILNNEVILNYHEQIIHLKKVLGLEGQYIWKSEIIPSLLKLPEAIQKGVENSDKNEWNEIENGIYIAIENILKFRLDEGKILEEDISKRINIISSLLVSIDPYARKRIKKVKQNLYDKLGNMQSKYFDENRFEQELIYYLEKQDITEEEVRLESHLNYFIKTMKSDSPTGKKLGFISQEIGREINTIGSKSSDIEMQMKDELEKIKEQLLNIL